MEIKIPNKVNKKIAKKIHRNYLLRMNLKKISPKFDLLICNSGFEKRTLGAIQASPSADMALPKNMTWSGSSAKPGSIRSRRSPPI